MNDDWVLTSLFLGHTLGSTGIGWWYAHVLSQCDDTCPWCFLGQQKDEKETMSDAIDNAFETADDARPGHC